MNLYIIVEGDQTETKVYPAWMKILVPNLIRVKRIDDLHDNNYYLFSGHGIPSIYDHIAASIEDINAINSAGQTTVNYLILSSNTQSAKLRSYRSFYDVREKDPEEMDNIDPTEFQTKAQFHHSYLKEIFKENNISYKKNKPEEVCKKHYLDRLIARYTTTGHIPSFGRWYEFIKTLTRPD